MSRILNKSLFHVFLIKYAEIGLKGKNRFMFEDALVENIKRAVKKVDGVFAVRKTPGRIFVEAESEFDFDELVDALQHVFGIVGICPVLRVADNGFEELGRAAVRYMADMYPDRVYGTGVTADNIAALMQEKGITVAEAREQAKTEGTTAVCWQDEYPSIKRDAEGSFRFKMLARRNRKNYPKDSQEINEDMGEVLLNAFPGLKVDVHKPEMVLFLEIRDCIYIYSEILPGPGGMPIGTGGKAMLLLSGGIDSPVAGYMISKRGVTVDAVYFHAPPYTSERAKQKVVDLARIISKYTGPIHLHVINFTDIQLAIYEKCPHEELTIIMRRYMMRIAEHLARECGALGLVTGESIGQVASQTMASLVATNEVCELPVFRPVIAFDKQDIVEISERIDTYETSILPFEDCCTIFVADHPVTKPNLNVIRKHEHNLDDVIEPLLQAAYDTDEVIYVEP